MAATAEALLNTLAGGSDGVSSGGSESGTEIESGGEESVSGGAGAAATAGTSEGADGSVGKSAAGESASEPGVKPTPEQLYQNAQAAIRETRTENKALKQQLQELTAKIEALSKPPAKLDEPPPEPDFLQDPKGYVDDTRKQIKQLIEKLESKEKEQTEAQKQQQAAQETRNKVISTEQEFAAATPDYYDAINHVRAVRAEQIKIEIREAEDREATPEEVGRILSIQEAQGAAALIAKGKNPSKFYYEYAKTFGYQPKAAAQPAAPSAPKPDKEAVRTMGSGGAGDSGGDDEPASDSPLGGLLAAAQNEHKAQFKRRK